MTRSPFFTLVTPRPTSTTTPAPSWPRIAGNNPSGSAPDSVNSSVWQTPVALISTSTSPSRGPGDFCRALEYRLHCDQIRPAQCGTADLSCDPDGAGGWADGCYRRDRSAAMAGGYRHRPQRGRGPSGAWILSRRHCGCHRAFDTCRAFGADSGPATDPDLDAREPLARRARHPAAMDGAVAWARGRGADPAQSPNERGGRLGMAGFRCIAGQHYLGHDVPEALLRQDRLALR